MNTTPSKNAPRASAGSTFAVLPVSDCDGLNAENTESWIIPAGDSGKTIGERLRDVLTSERGFAITVDERARKAVITNSEGSSSTVLLINALTADSRNARALRSEETVKTFERDNISVLTSEMPRDDSPDASHLTLLYSVQFTMMGHLGAVSFDDAMEPVIRERAEQNGFDDIIHAPIALAGKNATPNDTAHSHKTLLCIPAMSVSSMADHTHIRGHAPLLSDVVQTALEHALSDQKKMVFIDRDPDGNVLNDCIRVVDAGKPRPGTDHTLPSSVKSASITFNGDGIAPERHEDANKAAINSYMLVSVSDESGAVQKALEYALNAVSLDKALYEIQINNEQRELAEAKRKENARRPSGRRATSAFEPH